MSLKKLRFRQVHLDFHTSPHIERIGAAFEKKHWQETLKNARVNSITCFSKCHHGLTYHPTKVGTMHPHLKFDLLRAQMDASREIDVKVPVYLSTGLDNVSSGAHPEWREITSAGTYSGWAVSPLEPGFHKLCFNTPYVDFLCRQIEEAAEMFPDADGIFLDIVAQSQCCCKWCLEVMAKNGLDAAKESDRIKCSELAKDRYMKMTTEACKKRDANMPVFHNDGHITRGRRDRVAYQTHLELESLPTGGWGYDHFPESASYVSHLGLDYLGMTGKFHESWGEFGGFKHPNALRYECAAMNAFGAKCGIGDQLHPEGKLDLSTYAVIAPAYREVEASEPWCRDTVPVFDIGVLSSEAENGRGAGFSNECDTGASRLLLEGHQLFSLIDREVDFAKFRLLILPDDIAIDDKLKAKIDAYLARGGKLLLSGASGLKKDGSAMAFDIGADYSGPSPFRPDYIVPAKPYRASFVDTPLVMYTRSHRIKATRGKSLGDIYDPYFNRTVEHFCSHRHTPNRPEPSGFDCGVRNGNIVHLAHPVFTLYCGYGAVAYQEYVLKVIDDLLSEDKSVTTNLNSTARVTIRRQPEQKRQIVHLLYAEKIGRGGKLNSVEGGPTGVTSLAVIEDLTPLRDVRISVRPGAAIAKVTLEPQGKTTPFREEKGRIVVEIDSFTCHQMVVLHEA